MFQNIDSEGNVIRNRVKIDCSKDDVIVEQSHKDEVDINQIVKRHGGVAAIQATAKLQGVEFQFDDVTGNDFQEAMDKVTKAQQLFESLPAALRAKFDNSPAKYLDYVQNPEHSEELIKMGLAEARPVEQPIQVQVINPVPETAPPINTETPPA